MKWKIKISFKIFCILIFYLVEFFLFLLGKLCVLCFNMILSMKNLKKKIIIIKILSKYYLFFVDDGVINFY